jgi:enoyl-CoA hydratase/carnithine racemase
MDLNFAQDEHDNEQWVKKSIDLYSGILKKIHSCSKAVIALINGDVKAGGLGLISACDIIICSDKSTFELSEVLFGLIPANVLPFLFSLRLSPQKVRYLVISATKINAKEAHQIGLIDEFYEEELLEKALKRLLKTIFRASPDAIKQIKNFTSEIHNETFESRIEIAKQKLTQILTDKKVINAIKSFNQGDIPDWFSKFKPVGKLVL